MQRRIIFLPIAAVIITGLCAWRMTRPPRETQAEEANPLAYPPALELHDQQGRLVKLRGRLGRSPLIVFFLGDTTPSESESLLWLRENHEAVESAGYEVLAVSTARPAEIRSEEERTGKTWPFPILTDIHLRSPQPAPAHHDWGRIDSKTGAALPGLFLIDRKGYIEYENGFPKSAQQPLGELRRIVSKED